MIVCKGVNVIVLTSMIQITSIKPSSSAVKSRFCFRLNAALIAAAEATAGPASVAMIELGLVPISLRWCTN